MLWNPTLKGLTFVLASVAVAAMPSVTTADIEETITVVGTRTERSLDEVAATISVISSEDIEREVARDIADLVRFEPGVSVSGTGDRFGLGGFNIRGISGNRVLTMVDGVRVADEFSFGPFLSARRDFVDIDSVARAEIARGPISSLYGSDALGGVVAFTTKGPRDYLAGDETFHVGTKLGYSSADKSRLATVSLAGGNEQLSALLLYTKRDGEQTETAGSVGGFGPAREDADPQSVDTGNLNAKLVFTLSEDHEFQVSIDRYHNEADTVILSDYGTVSRGTVVNTRDSEDEKTRVRYSIEYGYTGDLLIADQLSLLVYQQASETTQRTFEMRTPPGRASQLRRRDSYYDQDISGVVLQLTKNLDFEKSSHVLTYGADIYDTENVSLRDGGTTDLNGTPQFEFFPLPTRDFPLTDVSQIAVFIQDEISLFDGRLMLSPGLRYDRFEANTQSDAVFEFGNPGSPVPSDYDDDEITGKIGAVYQLNDVALMFAQFSQGFRAPPYDDVNVGFTNFIGGYKTISNANLKSERSEGWELGLRYQGDFGLITVNAYTNDYEDFIESLSIAPAFAGSFGIDPTDGLLTFQSVNLSEVEIKGVELSADVSLGAWIEAMNNFSLRAAIAYADGEDKTSGEPLNSIEPLTGIFGVGYDAPSGIWGGDIIWTLVGSKDDGDINSNDPRLSTSGYGTLDLLAYWNFSEKVTMNIGVFNLTDKAYIRWADTAAIGDDAPLRFSQPGVNASASFRWML